MRALRTFASSPALTLLTVLGATLACIAPLAGCGDDGNVDKDTSNVPDGTNPPPDTNGGGNHPPELERVGDRSVAVGKSLVIELTAKDADQDDLTFSVFGNLPEGARFDKAAHRFEWSPSTPDQTVFLTFVVSDGTDFDRETVRIQVTAESTSNPPSFVEIGDQTVTVGQSVELKLEATDPDGDRLSFGHEGSLPEGAALETKTGVFTWRVGADVTPGTPTRITFTVSDGTASDSLVVTFIVDDGSGTGPKPPVLTAPSTVNAKVGEPVALTLTATDPNNDPITFSVKSGNPPGATLSGANFAWTPAQGDVGKTYAVTFAATDGTFTAVAETKISVSSGQVGTCTPDPEEPNEEIAQAKPLAIGTKTANLCETATTYDTDVWAIDIPAGQQLTVTMTFGSEDVDLDIQLYDSAGAIVASSEGVATTEKFRYAPPAAGTFYLFVYGYGLEPLALNYTLMTELGAPVACTNDDQEPNNLPGAAVAFTDELEGVDLQICATDVDFYKFDVLCGAKVEILMDIQDGADLDLYLYEDLAADSEVDSAITEGDSEIIEVPAAASEGTWLLEVVGYPENSAESGYQLLVDVTGGCEDDGKGNNSQGTAASTSGLAQGVICCGDDWFKLDVVAGDAVTIDVTPDGGAIGVVALASNGTTQLAKREPATTAGALTFTAAAAGTVFLKVSGVVGASYMLDIGIGAGGQCTLMSCNKDDVCDTATGTCVFNFCFDAGDCPATGAFACEDLWCVNPCQGDDACRADFACKSFKSGKFCGVDGPGAVAAECVDHSECAGAQICALQSKGGYCAQADCGSCPGGTKCATFLGETFCAKGCITNADCPTGTGQTCSAEKTCLPSP